ncbi:MAG: T9SS type A sorting domain-containing protein [Bacteroidetes bacterium]|nr:T9SS type A sorting domain-containing protein [Bacteroidota bacterium]
MKKSYLFLTVLLALTFFTAMNNKSYAVNFTTHTENDSCGGIMNFQVNTNTYTSGLTVKTYFGDGDSIISVVNNYLSTGRVYTYHNYASIGTYTVMHILYSGSTPVDTILFSVSVSCSTVLVRCYRDNNSNCIFDAGDNYMYGSMEVEIDSAGVKIDTISGIAQAYKLLTAGKTYTFKLITPPPGTSALCPSSGSITQTLSYSPTWNYIDFSMQCSSTSVFDLGINYWARYRASSATTNSYVYLWASNAACGNKNSTVTLHFSSKYNYVTASPTPTSVSGNTVIWSVSNLNNSTGAWMYVQLTPNTTVSIGDTACTDVTITPITGDANTANNTKSSCDSVRSSYDPNEKDVFPTTPIPSGSKLTYTLQFENMGNDTAFNVHILDTLNYGLNPHTLKVLSSSHIVSSTVYTTPGGQYVAKFDFPNIKLEDKNHPTTNKGYVTFEINTKQSLAGGFPIPNQAGIYFDGNPVVMTNTTHSSIQLGGGVGKVEQTTISVFPNPVHDVLNIKTKGEYQSAQIINTLGQVMIEKNITQNASIDVSSLTNGIYYLVLKGQNGTKAEKIEKR